MHDIALPLQDFLKSMDADAAKAYYVRRVHDAFARAIYEIYGPTATPLVLGHVQAVYIMDDNGTYVGDAKPPKILRIYTNDATVRADLDARQEFIKMHLARQGFPVKNMRLHASTFGMKQRTPYAGLLDALSRGEDPFTLEDAPTEDQENAYREASEESMLRQLQKVKQALCQVFREQADSVVKAIAAAYVHPVGKSHIVILYAPDPAASHLRDAIEPLAAHLRDLGLRTYRIDVRDPEPWMAHTQAYPPLSAPVVVQRPQ